MHVNLLVASYSQWSFLHPTCYTDKDHYCQDNTSKNFDTISRQSCNFCQHIWPNIDAGLSYHSALIPSTTDPLVPFNCALHSASYVNETLVTFVPHGTFKNLSGTSLLLCTGSNKATPITAVFALVYWAPSIVRIERHGPEVVTNDLG